MATEEDPISSAVEAGSERKERLRKVFANLEIQRAAIVNCTLEWKEFEDYFAELENSLQKRFQELVIKEKAFESKSQELQEALDKREEAVSAREQAMLSRVQEQKDSAIASLFEEKRKWLEEKTRLEVEAAGKSSPPQAAAVPESVEAITKPEPVPMSEVRVRPQLKTLCENMDGDGLRKYIVDHRKDVGAMRNELPTALQCAIDPARMVLGALDGYHLPEPGNGNSQPGADKNKDSGASANRRACILLLECLAVVLADPVLGADHPVVPSNIKESAKQLADQWKSKMNSSHGDATGNSLDAQSFLQLLATFGIAPEYNDDELCKLVTAVARRRQTPVLCRSLGLSSKIPDVVDRLAKEGKQIEALSFAHSFEIMDRVQPVPLLKTYLKEARKTAQSILKTGNGSTAAQNDAAMKELAALKAVLKCIEEYQLESQYPSMPLQKRVIQLEKAKSDRKRAAVAVKAHTKRPRASNGTGAGYGGVSGSNNNNNNDNRSYYRPSDRSQGQYGGGVAVSSYSLAAQNNYDRRGHAAYSTTYAGGNRSPAALSSSYLYSADGLSSQVYGSTGYNNPTATYSSYQFGSGLPPPPPAYQASFLH
ncbi:unnamed protein product [Sphagnum troendelagicum]|uniref:FRIGIDA-like protein n=1 Tax=Sphagnum troendelagicum TaxID=128251 RepID=A0ABP0U143_9BRYO